MAECVKVIVRCRPMNARENGLDCKCCLSMDMARGSCTIQNPGDSKAPPKMFTFDGVYFMDSTTESIYNDLAYPLVEGVTEGYNGTIFAYGQTGSGKSFSMQGITDPATQRGVIPRAFDHIFETVSVTDSCKYLIHASYLEIYNEDIRDLLGKDVKARLDLKEHPEKGVYVAGLSMHPVHSVMDCNHIMEKGWKNRSVGATLMNADSSRSHSIFTIFMEMSNSDEDGKEHIRAGKLNLVDLAGSERQAKTGATGDRLKEATKINLSLSALGNVISALVDGKSKHIPYRDSKLTRLLQDSLGGNTKTMMVACISPADNNYDETLSTLRYANRAKNIKNKPKINEDPKDALLRQYQEEIQKLKAMLMGQIPVPKGGFDLSTDESKSATVEAHQDVADVDKLRHDLEEEKDHLRQEYEEKMHEMQMEMETERSSRGKLQADMDKLRAFYDTRLKNVDGRLAHLPLTAAVLDEEVEWDTEMKVCAEKVKANPDQKSTSLEALDGYREGEQALGELPEPISSEDALLIGPDLAQPLIQGADGLPFARQTDEELVGKEGRGQSPTTPRGTTMQKPASTKLQQEEALKRLQALEQQMVGGENIDNTEIKERHKKRKMHAEDQRKKQLIRANRKMDDDGGIMVSIYEGIQEELRDKAEVLKDKQLMIESLQREIIDLQSEFEFDRVDYLDTIRKQDQQIKLLEAILSRVQPCLRRDSNYYNLDKVRAECKWDEEEQQWVLPKMTVDRTSLPGTGAVTSRSSSKVPLSVNGDWDDRGLLEDDFSDDRLRECLRRSGDPTNNYFATKRQSQLVSEPLKKPNMKEVREALSLSSQVTTNGFHGDGLSNDLRAAQVHGQLMTDEVMRKPSRLDALPALGCVGKKGKKKRGGHDPF